MVLQQPRGSETTSTDRDEMLTLLAELIHDVRDHIRSYEVDSPEDERLLIRWHRTLSTLLREYRLLQKETDIDEMEENMELLQRVTGFEDRS